MSRVLAVVVILAIFGLGSQAGRLLISLCWGKNANAQLKERWPEEYKRIVSSLGQSIFCLLFSILFGVMGVVMEDIGLGIALVCFCVAALFVLFLVKKIRKAGMLLQSPDGTAPDQPPASPDTEE
ncbi:MAG: hypothetical protein ACI4O0_00720 [Candidatus Limivicinus sp.]